MGYFDTVKHVIEKADVILLIIDSRMPDLAMNKELDLLVEKKGKGLIYVFNKIDLLSFEDLNELKVILQNIFKGSLLWVLYGIRITNKKHRTGR